jgi:hypothetical protein
MVSASDACCPSSCCGLADGRRPIGTHTRKTSLRPRTRPAPLPSPRAATGHTLPTSAPGLGSPHPHLHRDWAHPAHICAGTGLTPPFPPRRDWAHPSHICAGTGLAPSTSVHADRRRRTLAVVGSADVRTSADDAWSRAHARPALTWGLRRSASARDGAPRALPAVPTQPFPLSRSHSAVPTKPFPLSHSHLAIPT